MLNITKLAASNKSLVALVTKLTGDIKNLERDNLCLKKGGQVSGRSPTLYHHCKKEGYHQPDAYYELDKNKYKRPPGWRSSLCRRGTVIIHIKLRKSSDTLLTHNYHSSYALEKPLPSNTNIPDTGIFDS